MKRWIHSRLWIYFSFLILVISIAIAIGAIVILSLLEYYNWLAIFDDFPFLRWLLPIIVANIIGILLSIIVSHYILKPISKLSRHVLKVIDSDFSVQLDENHRIEEVADLYRSFNIMVSELKSIDRFQNDFTSVISHEFKTPLTRIQGYAQLLDQADISPEQERKYREYIIDSTKELTHLVDDILSISKLDNQEIRLEKEVIQLDEHIRRTLVNLQEAWEQKGIEIEVNLERIQYYGNPQLLNQVWTNLLENAIHHTHRHGLIQVTLKKQDSNILLIISDNGVGMPADQLHLIFDRFYQIERSRSQSGNGLGLAITKRIIDLHRGNISVESQEGLGSIFTIRLPLIKT